jgi:hypothetical protein
MKGYEYTAKYNLGYSVDYDPSFYRCDASFFGAVLIQTGNNVARLATNRCDANLVGRPWTNISSTDRGQWRPVYEIAYAYYVQRQNKTMPYTKQQIKSVPIEANDLSSNIGDDAGYGTLRFSLLEGEAWASP